MMHGVHRMRDVQAPIISTLAEIMKRCPGTISLGQGMVSYGPPPEALRVLSTFPADVEDNRYGAVEGSEQLIDAISVKLERENRIARESGRRVVVTAGGNMAFFSAVLAIADPGDEIILPTPFYFSQDMAISIAGCRTVTVPTDEAHQLRVEAIRDAITARTRAVVTISPNNPTGAVYPESVLREVNDLCAKAGVYHVHDEAYEYFVYDTPHYSPGSNDATIESTISMYSLSKAYGMAGWRVGYLVIPEHLFDSINKIQDANLICVPGISQAVARGALRVGRSYCGPKLDTLRGVREMVLQKLSQIPEICTFVRPEGAFYCFVDVDTQLDSPTLAARLIEEHRVAVVPGAAFGHSKGCSFRVSYGALEPALIEEGMTRLITGLRALAGRAGRG